MFWMKNAKFTEVNAGAHWIGMAFCFVVLLVLFYAVHLDNVARQETDLHLETGPKQA
jgi:Na+-transporting methylmalonyl-CoA/oxaloacetate decarboxylase gamma subunit